MNLSLSLLEFCCVCFYLVSSPMYRQVSYLLSKYVLALSSFNFFFKHPELLVTSGAKGFGEKLQIHPISN